MSLSLYPTEDGLNWVPQVGAWAVMTLDPLDSLVRVHLDDAEARELVALLHPKKYVVYIAREGRRLLDPNPLGKPTFVVESHVELLMQGLPDTDRSACLDSGMCIPVFPETYHPTNERLPLVTSSPIANKEFPFRNAYLAPLTASLFVRSVATQTSDGLWQLSAREQASHNFWAAQDCIKRDVWAEHGEGAFESWWEHAGMGIPPSGYAHEDDDEEEGQLVTLPPHEWRDKSLPPTPYTGMSSNVQSDCESVKPPPRRRDSTTAGSVATSDSLDPDTISLRTVSAVDGVTSYLRIPQPSRKWYNFNLSPFPVPDKLKNANFDSMVDLSSNIGPIPFESLVPMVTLSHDLFSVLDNPPMKAFDMENLKLEPPEDFFKELKKLKAIAGGAIYRQSLLTQLAHSRVPAVEMKDDDVEVQSVLSNATNKPLHKKVSRAFSGLGKRVNSVRRSIRSSISES